MTKYWRMIALPTSHDPLFNTEFEEWCEGQGIICRFTRVGAMVRGIGLSRSMKAIGGVCLNTGRTVPPEHEYYIWKVFGDDREHVAVTLRWYDEMAKRWFIPEIERDFAEASGETLDHEHYDRI